MIAAAAAVALACVTVPTASAEAGATTADKKPLDSSLSEVRDKGAVTAQSPDRSLRVAVSAADGQLKYSVTQRGQVIVGASGMGLDLVGRPTLTQGMQIKSVERREIDETWKPLWGSDAKVRNHAKELTIGAVQDGTGFRLDVSLRVFDDGIGFRYHFPKQEGLNEYTVAAERTEFALDPAATSWSLAAGTFCDADEQHYTQAPLSTVATAQTPMTLMTPTQRYVVVHEADLTDYPSMTLKSIPDRPGVLRSELISLPDGTKAKLQGEFSTPWRTLTIGDRPGDLAESHLTENLNDPCAICKDDTSWIAPATYVGVWWELQRRATTWTAGPNHGATTARVKEYIDLAKKAGAKFVLAEGWNKNAGGSWANQDFLTPQDDFDLDEVLAYGRANGIGFIAHNETRGYIDYYDQNMEKIFTRYEQLGIHAIKTGHAGKFVLGGVNRSHYDQEAVRYYQRVIDAAARHHITVDAHEAIKPTGLARTYPNMMTGEGVAGMEQQHYKGRDGNPPAQATILPLTRFIGGPADYTPGVLNVTWDPGRLGTRVQTTSTAQLALYTAFFSPLQMLADTPENYAASAGFSYLKDMPATWDQTKVLDSVIGDYVTTARRKNDTWYVGSITDENDRSLQIPLRFLDRGQYVAEIYSDAQETTWKGNPLPIEIRNVLVQPSTDLTMSMVAGGGTAVRIQPARPQDLRSLDQYVAPRPKFSVESAVLDDETQRLTLTVEASNTGSNAATFPAQVFVDGRAAGTERNVRVAGGGTRTVELTVSSTYVPDRDFNVAVGAPHGQRSESQRVEQPQSLFEALRDLRESGDIVPAAANRLEKLLRQSDMARRAGDATGRLLALQDLRMALYGYGKDEVTVPARDRVDEILSLRLGTPVGLVELAHWVRVATDAGDIDAAFARTIVDKFGIAVDAASEEDSDALATSLQDVIDLIADASSDQIAVEVADELTTRIETLNSLNSRRQFEAEDQTFLGKARKATDHLDYTGSGFVAGIKAVGDGVELKDAVDADGDYRILVRYANAMGATMKMTLAHGGNSTRMELPNLADWDTWANYEIATRLSRGDKISVVWTPGDTGNVNLDSITLMPDLGVVNR